MIYDSIQLLWFFLPAAWANMAPVLANNIPALDRLGVPVDARLSFRKRRILGDHKTLRGFIAGWVMAAVVILLQVWAYAIFPTIRSLSLIDYLSANVLLLSLVLGFGPLFGDAIKSFFKRQVGIEPGKNWFPFDQLDFVAGTLLLAPLVIDLSWYQISLGVALALLLHPATNILGWILRLKDKPL
jgi:CDP-2,3-bis-(O-geranylgeranyl)-sn-glycerol synthase